MTAPTGSVFVIIVNFRTGRLTVQCLASLAAEVSSLGSGRVIVVDNCSEDDSVTLISSAIHDNGWEAWAELLPLPRNGGFAYGNNAAIGRARQLDPQLAAVVLLNPDAIARPGLLAALMRQLASQPRAGIAGAAIEGAGGELVVSAHAMPSPLGELEASAKLGFLTRLLSRHVVSPPPTGVSRECDWVSGACMAIRREVLDAVGPLDEGFFLYYEEVDFCRRARQAGWSCWLVADARVMHLEGAATGIKAARQRLPAYWFASRRRFFVKAYGIGGLVLADLLWALGRTSLVLRRLLGLGGRAGHADEPSRMTGDLLLGDVRAALGGELVRIARGQ
ncbi:MAG TPA: glycosyltransferase family 2 protein [Caldimonas sp.]|nr:glycosyltransferase family 2 protein [Caldimonas sp.]